MAMDRVPDAVATLEKAVEISPETAVLYFELARAYALNREYTRAVGAYHKVVELNPSSTLADRALVEARKLKNRK
jgi:tetratricopeptide (TPR) repeat protein